MKETMGQIIRRLRKERNLTQDELAEQLGVTFQAISKWENDTGMPDISQIVPLAAIFGITTDCLLGVGGDENADREKLYAEVEKLNKGIEKVYSRNDNAYYESYVLYKEHIKKYPFDYEVKFLCADSLLRHIYYGQGSTEEKDRFYIEAISLLKSVINYDRDTTRIIDAKQTLIILYLYHNDFANAEAIAEGLPQRGSIRASMEMEIYSKKNDFEKCVDISNSVCSEAVQHYLWALAVRARRISLLGNSRKQDAIAAWYDFLEGIKFNYKKFPDINIHTKWLYSGLNNLANDYITISEIDKAFDVIEELTNTLIFDYNECRSKGDISVAEEIKGNLKFYLNSCYNLCFTTNDNEITNNPRFKKCEQMLQNVD